MLKNIAKSNRRATPHLDRVGILIDGIWATALALTSAALGLWVFREGPRGVFLHMIPLSGDGASTAFFLRLLNGNSFSNLLFQNIQTSQTGWPGQLNYSFFPVGQTTELIAIRLVSKISGITDPSILIHMVSILKVVPISLAVYILARTLRLPRFLGFLMGLAYSVSTFNLIRSEGHFFLALTWPIALGLAAIFLAFEQSKSQNSKLKNEARPYLFLKLTLLLIFVAFSSFYYILILGLIVAAFVLAATLSELWSLRFVRVLVEFKTRGIQFLQRTWALLYVSAFLLIGLLAQTLPILLRAGHSFALTGLADRSPTESIVYAGSLESFFYDSSTFVLRILGRPDLSNFLGSRISWEGSQLGALTGFVAYAVITILVLQVFKNLFGDGRTFSWLSKVNEDIRFRFIFLISIFSLALYLPDPLNFTISRFVPQIRAWGRVSTVLTLLSLCLLGLVISRLKGQLILATLLTAALVLVPLSEASIYRQGRPASAAVSISAQQLKDTREKTIAALKNIYPKGCAIFLAPVYPFPEFDIPTDSNGDYAALALPMQDDGYFKWSYPAIKDTASWSAFQPLASEAPNFARASLSYQTDYARALGACGAVIDRTLLTPQELSELIQIPKREPANCFVNLPGEEFNTEQRFASLSFRSGNCSIAVSPSIRSFAKQNLAAKILWKIDEPYGLSYIDKWQVFAGTSPIDFRLIKSKKLSSQPPVYSFLFTPVQGAAPLVSVKVCLRKTTEVVATCQNVALDSKGQGSLVGDPSQLGTSLQKYEITIAPESAAQIENWGLVVGV